MYIHTYFFLEHCVVAVLVHGRKQNFATSKAASASLCGNANIWAAAHHCTLASPLASVPDMVGAEN